MVGRRCCAAEIPEDSLVFNQRQNFELISRMVCYWGGALTGGGSVVVHSTFNVLQSMLSVCQQLPNEAVNPKAANPQ
jgi:hypothetical protein